MKRPIHLLGLCALAIPLAGLAGAQEERQPIDPVPPAEEERLEPTPGELHIRSHHVDVVITGGFATTTIDQVLDNPTDRALEATWSFPLPEEASLSELSMKIGERRLIGEVVEKQEAKRIYEAEKEAGESSALAEQNGTFDYRVSVTPVPPRGEVLVRVVYYQPLEIDQGVGRYVYPLEEGNTDDAAMDQSFWAMEKTVRGEMRIDVTMKTSFPIDGLHCPSHSGFVAAEVEAGTWRGTWSAPEATLDRDFVLFYRLAEDVPARIEVLTSRYRKAGEGTFMAVITPGDDLAETEGGTDWMFVLDTSGSMKGEKLRALRRGVVQAIDGLRQVDRFQVIEFSNGSHALTSEWLQPGTSRAAKARGAIEAIDAGGGTNIFGALDLAYGRLDADRPCAIILVSDGVANTGPHEYRDFIELAKSHDARLFTFVMGNGAKERLLDDLATLSGGFAKSVSMQDEIGAHLMLARTRMSHEAMHGIALELRGATVIHPKLLPSLYLGQQLVVFGRYDRFGETELSVTARISGEERTWRVPVVLPEYDPTNPELERLYALAAIADLERAEWLDGVSEGETREAIVDVAVAYGLVTDHTSMVVVDDARKVAYGLGSENAERRAREDEAARQRAVHGSTVQVQTGGEPLGGSRASHAPSGSRRSGGGAIGPVELLGALGLVLLGCRGASRRRKDRG